MKTDIGDPWMGSASFGVTFFTSSQRHDTCGTNGLPLTPNSIRILGKAQRLKTLQHPNLAEYVDVIRGKHERMIVVLEYYPRNLRNILKNGPVSAGNVLKIGQEVLSGLVFLHKRGIVCRTLSLETVLLDDLDRPKIFNYGLNYMTNNGKYVAFPIGNPKYTAPEIFLSQGCKCQNLNSCDSWSLGLILLELALGIELWADHKLPQIIKKVASLRNNCDSNVLLRLLQEHGFSNKDLDGELKQLIESCLELNSSVRPTAEELLESSFGVKRDGTEEVSSKNFRSSLKFLRMSDDIVMNGNEEMENVHSKWAAGDNQDLLAQRSLKEVYYLWQLAGGDVFGELKKQGLTRKKPAVLSLPCSMTLEGQSVGKSKERGLLLDNTVIVLPLQELRKRLQEVPPEDYFPLIMSTTPFSTAAILEQSQSLPLIIREKDIEYQFHRILLFDRLIKGYPYTKSQIRREAFIDVPPYFRAQIWSCLLDIQGDIQWMYGNVDKHTPTTTDRQIEVDIPRCHQYDELLSSPAGHEKFKRVLKAWVVSSTEYVYWQGLDSLCAPFLYLNFNNEAMAYFCLSTFIPKYLYDFFLKDNSMVIQEYLAKFSQLITFHDPQLTNHLDAIGFIPELYAIPWFLTMFSHVFPLHKIFHLWDKLLLGDASFPLCIGLSILQQLRESLLTSGFNECILLFSDMPEINIELCVEDSVRTYRNTPRSVFCRQYEPPNAIVDTTELDGGFSSDVFESISKITGVPVAACKHLNVNGLRVDPIPLPVLKQEKCARISGEDVLHLLEVNGNSSKAVIVDVRNHEDFIRGMVPTSINLPFATSFTPEGNLVQNTESTFLNNSRGKLIVVAGSRVDSAVKFSEALLRLEYPRICVLHRGIDVLRSCNILTVQSPM